MTDNTVLRLVGMGIPPYSARGMSETLTPIQQSQQIVRTVNGNLLNLSDEQFQKYSITISGEDQQSPALDNAWPGHLLTIDCISELCVEGTVEEPTEDPTESATEPVAGLGRHHVPGSIRHESGFTFYRPRLECMLMSFSVERDEWGAAISWSLIAEER